MTLTPFVIGLLLALRVVCMAQDVDSKAVSYSTCPDGEHLAMRNTAYLPATEENLRKWAVKHPEPKRSSNPETVGVRVMVEHERVFCAQALYGSHEKQKAAVEAAMKWTFEASRGDFNDNVEGELTFEF